MPKIPETWLIPDPHWNHPNVIANCGRPQNHKELTIQNLRGMVKPTDTTIFLGDIILYNYNELKGILDSIPGSKILTIGNHDRKTKGWYTRNGFTYVADMIVQGEIILTHKPLQEFPTGVTHNIHGHWHNTRHPRADGTPNWWSTTTHTLLSLENMNYKPIKFSTITNKIKHHRDFIACDHDWEHNIDLYTDFYKCKKCGVDGKKCHTRDMILVVTTTPKTKPSRTRDFPPGN